MTQNFIQANENIWWCCLCPANYMSHPHETAQGHFGTMHTIEELYDPNRAPFRGTWPETKKELLDKLSELIVNDVRGDCCIDGLDRAWCRGRVGHSEFVCNILDRKELCPCKCHEVFDIIEKLETTL